MKTSQDQQQEAVHRTLQVKQKFFTNKCYNHYQHDMSTSCIVVGSCWRGSSSNSKFWDSFAQKEKYEAVSKFKQFTSADVNY